MAKIADATFKGKTESYKFEVYDSKASFNDVPGVYVFTKRTLDSQGKGTHTLLYIGQTDKLGTRIGSHEKWDCVKKVGVNCICFLGEADKDKRFTIETDLRNAFNTPCNDQ
jgi:hypothetical protein